MKIINKTNWQTLDLKRILTKALNEDDKIEGKCKNSKYLEVEIVDCPKSPKWVIEHYKKCGMGFPQGRRAYTGNAFLNGYNMKMRLPENEIDKRKLVKLFRHELTHIRGYKHNKMIYWLSDNDIGNWMDSDINYPIRQKENKTKPKVDLQTKRYEHVMRILKAKKSQLKRLQNQIKKWSHKRKYYEGVLVANGKIKKED